MIIRKAATKDAIGILELMKQLIDLHHRLDPYYKQFSQYRNLRDYINEAATSRDKILLVAEEDNAVLGYIIGTIEETPFYATEDKIGAIADATVAEQYRRRGVLRLLFNEALAWFNKKGIKRIELSVDARNEAAVAAWKKLGFKDYKLRMYKNA
ncbi:MAG: GNAT family N-acetyltransferase [Patescibacteria group bacterium]